MRWSVDEQDLQRIAVAIGIVRQQLALSNGQRNVFVQTERVVQGHGDFIDNINVQMDRGHVRLVRDVVHLIREVVAAAIARVRCVCERAIGVENERAMIRAVDQ